jgi:RNA polymerase sigma-70 factor (ECF subfamily)
VCRSAVRRLGLPQAFGERVEAIADARDLEHEVARREEHAAVRRALAALPPHYRDALVLYYFHDMDVDAASKTLGVPQGTLKARLARGRDALRKRLTRLTAGELAEEKR